MKICSRCGNDKELSEFYKNKNYKDGYFCQCKQCTGEKAMIRYNNDDQINKNNCARNKKDPTRKQKQHDYQVANKVKIRANHDAYVKKRYKEDPLFRLSAKMRTTMGNSMKKRGHIKNCKTTELLGCSFEFLKQHLESQFEPWMNWDNMGGKDIKEINTHWDIDHKIPLSSAKTKEELLKLYHYENLQPLCSFTNRFIKRNQNANFSNPSE